jgi:hypothetical protein
MAQVGGRRGGLAAQGHRLGQCGICTYPIPGVGIEKCPAIISQAEASRSRRRKVNESGCRVPAKRPAAGGGGRDVVAPSNRTPRSSPTIDVVEYCWTSDYLAGWLDTYACNPSRGLQVANSTSESQISLSSISPSALGPTGKVRLQHTPAMPHGFHESSCHTGQLR